MTQHGNQGDGRIDALMGIGTDRAATKAIPPNTFSAACAELRAAGHTLAPSDIPGLTIVDGAEMTMGQIISRAFPR